MRVTTTPIRPQEAVAIFPFTASLLLFCVQGLKYVLSIWKYSVLSSKRGFILLVCGFHRLSSIVKVPGLESQ